MRTNAIFEIRIPQRQMFLDRVARTVTKGRIGGYTAPPLESLNQYPYSPGLSALLQPDSGFTKAKGRTASQRKAFEFFEAHLAETEEIAKLVEAAESQNGRVKKDFVYAKYQEFHIEPPFKNATLDRHFRAYYNCHSAALATK